MKLLKLIAFIFLIYFIRRFIQAYRVMKRIQEEAQRQQQHQYQQGHAAQSTPKPQEEVIQADFRVIKD